MLHLADFGDTSEMQNAVQTNQSLLGSNLLYAEESETGYVFTNYTTTRSVFWRSRSSSTSISRHRRTLEKFLLKKQRET